MRLTNTYHCGSAAIFWVSCVLSPEAWGQTALFQRVLTLELSPDPLVLSIALSGRFEHSLQREGEIRISGFTKNLADKSAAERFFKSGLV